MNINNNMFKTTKCKLIILFKLITTLILGQPKITLNLLIKKGSWEENVHRKHLKIHLHYHVEHKMLNPYVHRPEQIDVHISLS